MNVETGRDGVCLMFIVLRNGVVYIHTPSHAGRQVMDVVGVRVLYTVRDLIIW